MGVSLSSRQELLHMDSSRLMWWTSVSTSLPLLPYLCFFLSMASRFHWPINSFDVKSSFLHSNIDQKIYIKPFLGVEGPSVCVLKLWKELFGMDQASCFWWLHLTAKIFPLVVSPILRISWTMLFQTMNVQVLLYGLMLTIDCSQPPPQNSLSDWDSNLPWCSISSEMSPSPVFLVSVSTRLMAGLP